MKITTKKFLISLYAITAVAFILRIALGYTLLANESYHILNPVDGTDSQTYLKFAHTIANGEWNEEYYYQPLYYSWFLAPLFMIFGASVTVIIWAQSFLGAVTVFITGLFAARLHSRKAGLLAAIVLCLYKNHIMYSSYALIATLQTFLITAFFYFFFRYMKQESWKFLLIAALFCSLSILCRGNCILIMPVCLAIILYRHRKNLKSGFCKTAVFLVIIYGLQVPFSLNNYKHKGIWKPSTAGSIVMAIGNNPQAPPGTDDALWYMDSTDAYKHWVYLDKREENRIPLKTSMFNWILSEPFEWLELKMRVALLFFSRHEGYNNINFSETVYYAPWFKFPFISFWAIGIPFCTALLFNLFTKRWRKGSRNFIYVSTLIYIGSIVLFYFLSRYRLPIAPVMIVTTSAFVFKVLHYRKSVSSKLKVLIPLFTVSALVILGGFDFYRKNLEAWVMTKLHDQTPQFVRDGKDFILREANSRLWGGYKTHRVEHRDSVIKIFKSKHFKEIGKRKCVLYLNVVPEEDNTIVRFIITHRGKKFFWQNNLKKAGDYYIKGTFESDFQNKEETVQVDLEVSKPVGVGYTPQRNFGRSRYKDKVFEGEWDVSFIVKDYTPE